MKHNFIAKNMHVVCQAVVMTDRKKSQKKGKQKHKVDYKKDHSGPF